jgi:hypothetical protein
MSEGLKIFKSDTHGLVYAVIETDKTDARFWVSTVSFVDLASFDAGSIRIPHKPNETITALDVKCMYRPGVDLNIDSKVLRKLSFAAKAA